MNSFNFLYGFYPNIPSLKPMRPPLLYDLMNSIVNFGQEDKYSITELSKKASPRIFNFNYPLSSKVNKEEFEEEILNNFINRRIGFETFTLWQIKLKTKLNEIMPTYNKMFDAITDWNLFQDGEKSSKTSTDNRNITSNTNAETTTNSNTENIADLRYSETPENAIENVQNGNYLTTYNYNKNNANDTSTSNTESNNATNDSNQYSEENIKDVSNKIDVYTRFLESKNNIMSMIFNDLEILFYQVID